MSPKRLRLAFRLAFAAALLVIMWLALSRSPAPALGLQWDKANHFMAFLVLAFLLDYSWRPNCQGYQAEALARIGQDWPKWLVLSLFGACIELVQWWSAYRAFELLDMLADAMGIAGYLLLQPYLAQHRWLLALKQP